MSSRLPFVLLFGLVGAASAALVNCSAPGDDTQEESGNEDDVVGVHNTMGLALTYDAAKGKVVATLKKPLSAGEKLHVRVRRGTITHDAQAKLDCSALAVAPPLENGKAVPSVGKTLFEGPSVAKELINLLSVYNDPRWYGGHETPEMLAEIAKGPDSIVEACVVKDGKVRAKLLTNLAYAWDRGEDLAQQLGTSTGTRGRPRSGGGGVHILGADAGAGEGGEGGAGSDDAGTDAAPLIPEGPTYNTIDYANLCEQELGAIPFFKKIADGKYETFDCRDFVGSNSGGEPAAVPGVEGAVVPLSVNDVPKTECDDGRRSSRTYDCVDKCDRGMYLTASSHTGLGERASCQPGVTVTTAKNDKGSHWILLCRKVEARSGESMMKTKVFNDIAMIGTNPKTGKTCFFQNKENIGNDGSRVTHPGDVAQSSAIWPSEPSSYCTGSCHSADAFVHSPWIDEAKRADGTTIVPKQGVHADFPISALDRPYSLINGEAQGFRVPDQLVSEKVEVCTTCHRVAGASFPEFAEWATGTGDAYYSKITDTYKSFEKSHWMPPRLDGLTAETFPTSRWGIAVKHIRDCIEPRNGPRPADCEFAPIPR